MLDNADKNHDHNDCDGYIILIRTMIVTTQVGNIQ